MRLFASTSAGLAAIASVLLLAPASVQAKDDQKPDASRVPMQQSPKMVTPERTVPGRTKQPVQGGGVLAPRTHCNGTCMCTGSDCNLEWTKANCKDGSVTCSGGVRTPSDPDSHKDKICTCVRKAASN